MAMALVATSGECYDFAIRMQGRYTRPADGDPGKEAIMPDRKRILGVVVFLVVAPLILGDVALGDENKEAEITVIVTATKEPESVKELPFSVNVVTKEDLEMSKGITAADALNQEPGIFVLDTGQLTIPPTNIHIRGLGNDPTTEVAVLVDGRPDVMALMGHPMLEALQTDDMERIEVVRGPASSLYGSGAMGGVINIVSRKPETTGIVARAGLGEFASRDAHLSLSAPGRTGYIVTYGHRETDGYRPNSSFNSDNYTVKAYRGESSLRLQRVKYSGYDPGTEVDPLVGMFKDFDRGGADLETQGETAQGWWNAHFYRAWGRNEFADGWLSHDYVTGLVADHRYRTPPGLDTLTTGVDFKRLSGDAFNVLTAHDYGSHYQDYLASYAIGSRTFPGSVRAFSALRAEKITGHSLVIAPTLGVTKDYDSGWAGRFSVGRAYRAPSIRELVLLPPSNPDLEMEKMWSWELGCRGRLPDGTDVDLAFYLIQADNLISLVAPPPQWQNSGPVTHKGMEISLKKDCPWGRAGLNYTYLDRERNTAGNPAHRLNLEGRVNLKVVALDLNLQYVSRNYGGNNFQNPLPGYWLGTLKARQKHAGPQSLYLQVLNLFNHNYEVVPGYPSQPRTFWIGLERTVG